MIVSVANKLLMASSAGATVEGEMWGSGGGHSGKLGDGTTVSKSSPVQVGSISNFTDAAVGNGSVYGITADGKLYAWGEGTNGALGHGNVTSYSVPTQVGALTDWARIYAEQRGTHAYAIKTDGTLWAWGQNANGALGLGDVVSRSSPVQVGALTDWDFLYPTSTDLVMAVKTDGTLWGWGSNLTWPGILGTSTAVAYSSPVQIGALTTYQAIVGRSSITTSYGAFFYIKDAV